MNPSDDPWAAPAHGQGEPSAAPPPSPPAQRTGQEPGSRASASVQDRTGPGSHRPASTARSATCYLLHFDRPYIGANGKGLARHYSGSATNLPARLAEHDKGHGARLLQVVKAAGISWRLARTWPGGRDRERQLKNQGGASRRCPECGVKPRTPSAEPKDTTSVKHPPRREPSPRPGTRPPDYVIEVSVSEQLRNRTQPTAGASPEAGRSAGKQPREPASPQLPDMEAEL